MKTTRDVPVNKLLEKAAEELKNIEAISPHKLSAIVKSGVCCERPPVQTNFWHIRSAALLRKIYLNGPVGVERLRNAFGKRKRRGHKPAHHKKAGGKFIRLMIQQLEQAKLVKKGKGKTGRIVTKEGKKFLDNISKNL